MEEKVKFGKSDVGCWIDGARGHKEVHRLLFEKATHHGWIRPPSEPDQDDQDDETEYEDCEGALDFLNELCEKGYHFEFVDGSLVFLADEDFLVPIEPPDDDSWDGDPWETCEKRDPSIGPEDPQEKEEEKRKYPGNWGFLKLPEGEEDEYIEEPPEEPTETR